VEPTCAWLDLVQPAQSGLNLLARTNERARAAPFACKTKSWPPFECTAAAAAAADSAAYADAHAHTCRSRPNLAHISSAIETGHDQMGCAQLDLAEDARAGQVCFKARLARRAPLAHRER